MSEIKSCNNDDIASVVEFVNGKKKPMKKNGKKRGKKRSSRG